MADAHYLSDKDGKKFYPYAHASATYDNNGNTVENRLKALDKTTASAVQSVKIGTTEYKSGTTVTLPSYPTSLPASDVPSWAKQKTKPTYSASEIGLGNVDNTADANKSVKYATNAGSANAVVWSNVNGKPAIPESGDYSSDNIEALLKKVMGLTPRMGSACFTKDTHVGNIWWNFFYIPHRDGVGSNNGDYGTLLLFPMTGNGTSYIVRAGKGGVVASISSIITSSNIGSQSVASATTVNGHTVNSNVPANAKFTDTNTWRPLGTTADTACAGNDSRLSNARPASDVYAWAKANSKPSYSKSEVGLGNVDNTADSAKSVKYATSAGSASSASKATGIIDYGSTSKTIQIGYGGDGISGDAIKYIAGYTTGNGSDVNAKIKDVSKDALKSWLGLGSLAYSSATIPTIPSSLPANGGTATYANYVYATSHQGSWYQNSQWDGTYFQTNYKNGNNVLPMKVGYAGYADSSGSASSVAWSNVSGRPSSMPASDVYSWAKASSKPSYTASEVGAAAANHSHSNYLTGINKSMVVNALGYTPPKTDTNTWRGVQNNLTSTATDQSLSAYQGKVLRDMIHRVIVQSSEPTISTNDEWLLEY